MKKKQDGVYHINSVVIRIPTTIWASKYVRTHVFQNTYWQKAKKDPIFCSFYFGNFQKMNIFAGFIFQKIGKNRKNLENFWSQKFLPIMYFDIRARKISLYTSIFRACNFTYAPNLAPKKMDPQNQSVCPIKKELEALLFFFFIT